MATHINLDNFAKRIRDACLETVLQAYEDAGGRAVNIGGSTGLAYFRPAGANFEAREITVEDCEFLGGMCAVASAVASSSWWSSSSAEVS